MSSLQDKLYNYEQTPPANAWDKIAAALDESHLDDEFPSKLYNTEVVPPANVWDNITTTLDESAVTEKYPSKLYNAEVTPPAGVWNKIAGALGPEQATVVQMTKKFSFFRYAAAAVLIGLVAFGVIKWANSGNSNSNDSIADKNNGTPHNERTDTPVDPNKEATVKTSSDESADEVAADREIKTSPAKKIKSNYSIPDNLDATQEIYAVNEQHRANLADKYFMLMTPDGSIVRMSKKWSNLVCCVSGQEQDPDCKDQLKKWQQKLATSPVATSNFMDILNLVNTLNNTEL